MVNLSFEITVRAGPRIQFGCLGFLHTSILVTLFTGSQFQTWRRIHEVTLYQDLSLQITHPAQERLATPLGSTSPTLFKQWCGFF